MRLTKEQVIAESIFQTLAPGPEIKWAHCSVCDATLTRTTKLIHDALESDLAAHVQAAEEAQIEETANFIRSINVPEFAERIASYELTHSTGALDRIMARVRLEEAEWWMGVICKPDRTIFGNARLAARRAASGEPGQKERQ